LTIAPIEETVDEILEFIREFYQRMDSGLDIENELYKLFDELKEDLWTLIEYPYVDKVYRDSYYTYFASKHNAYARDCIRVSFFAGEINHEEFRSATDESRLKNLFRGYLVIRPTSKKSTISFSDLLNGQRRIDGDVVAPFNRRISERMNKTVREFQKKQRSSLEKASRIVLNA